MAPSKTSDALLIEHADAVRRLAGHLVRDPARADDVAQESMLAGLTRAPAAVRDLGAWLRGVVRRKALMDHRSTSRRRRYEEGVPERSGPDPVDVALSHVEVQQTLMDAVRALPAAGRAVIWFRYFEGVSAKEIARRLDVPVETVRTRLKRALAKLRQDLDRRHGGVRSMWMAALMPVLVPGTSSASVVVGTGALAMLTKSVWTWAVVLVMVLVGGWVVFESKDAVGRPDSGAGTRPVQVAGEPEEEPAGPAQQEPVLKPGASRGDREKEEERDAEGRYEVEVALKLADGRVPERALIVVAPTREAIERGGGRWWSPARPRLRLVPGTHWLKARAGDDLEFVSKVQRIIVAQGGPEGAICLVLDAQPVIVGHVSFPDGIQPMGGLDVWARRFAGREPPPADRAILDRERIRGRFHDREDPHAFRMLDVTEGRYLLMVTASHTLLASTVVEVGTGVADATIRVPAFDAKTWMIVRVTGPEGEPVLQPELSLSISGGRVQFGGPALAAKRPDGSLLVRRRPSVRGMPDLPRSEQDVYTLTVRVGRLGERSVSYDPDGETEIEIRFTQPASVDLHVLNLPAGVPASSWRLYLKDDLSATGMGFSGGGLALTPAGRCVLDEIQSGPHVFVLVHGTDGDPGAAIQVDAFEVLVRPGDNELSWALGTLSELAVEFADPPEAPVRFCLSRTDGVRRFVQQFRESRDDGTLVFPHVPPGRYQLDGQYRGQRVKMDVTVPTNGPVRID